MAEILITDYLYFPSNIKPPDARKLNLIEQIIPQLYQNFYGNDFTLKELNMMWDELDWKGRTGKFILQPQKDRANNSLIEFNFIIHNPLENKFGLSSLTINSMKYYDKTEEGYSKMSAFVFISFMNYRWFLALFYYIFLINKSDLKSKTGINRLLASFLKEEGFSIKSDEESGFLKEDPNTHEQTVSDGLLIFRHLKIFQGTTGMKLDESKFNELLKSIESILNVANENMPSVDEWFENKLLTRKRGGYWLDDFDESNPILKVLKNNGNQCEIGVLFDTIISEYPWSIEKIKNGLLEFSDSNIITLVPGWGEDAINFGFVQIISVFRSKENSGEMKNED